MEQIKEIRNQIYLLDDQIASLIASNLPKYLIDIKWRNLLYQRTELFNKLLETEKKYDSLRTA